MQKVKKFLFLILAFSLMLLIASCGGDTACKECVDNNGDSFCDVCNKEIPEVVQNVPLFIGGKPNFQVVLSEGASDEVKQTAVDAIQAMLKTNHNVDVSIATEKSAEDQNSNVEILIGEVTSRGDRYFTESRSLGKQGFVIQIIGSKIIINAGSDETLVEAIKIFSENVLTTNDITELKMNVDDVMVSLPEYFVTSIKVNGNSIKDYTVAADLTKKRHQDAALAFQDAIYQEIGYWLEVVDLESATDKSVIIKHTDDLPAEESFRVSVKGSQLFLECSYDNSFESATAKFTTQKISMAKGEIDFKDTVYTQDVSVVYYEDFGAKGDGRTDDFFALYNAHVFANESGQTVKPSRKPPLGLTYYIYDTRPNPEKSNSTVSIPIQTTTDWQGVKFIINDEKIPTFTVQDDPVHAMNYQLGKGSIFSIIPEEEHVGFSFRDKAVLDSIAAAGLNPDTTHINFKIDGWDGDLMIVPYNSEHKVFRRRGAYNTIPLQSEGADMHEVIVIDKDGNVSPETPIMFEYTNIDYMIVYKLDPSTAITVGNATIETISSRVQNKRIDENGKNLFSTKYIERGIYVTRSYTTVHDIEHIVSGGYTLKERANGFESCNYQGMFKAANANHVTFKDCKMPGRQSYDGHSSYNFNAICVNKIVLDGCIQTNFWITYDAQEGIMHPSPEYSNGAVPSLSIVEIYDDNGKAQEIRMCWGLGGTNYCKNMEYLNSQISRFDAHAGLYNGKIINSNINFVALTGYGDFIMEDSTWYQADTSTAMLSLRSDYGFLWNGNLSVKNTKAYIYDITTATPSINIVGHNYTNFYFGYPTCFPSVTIDNLDVYSTKHQEPVKSGYVINLYKFLDRTKQMHILGDSGVSAIFTYSDKDKDGYIDEPLFDINMDGRINDDDRVDFDKDGKVGNTSMLYADHKHKEPQELNKGIPHPNCVRNLNPVRPPEFIKIINNDGVDGKGGYVYYVVNTANQKISDGGWYRDKDTPDTMGGFFGNTKFIYGEGEGEYFHGTNYPNQTKTTTFKFILNYYQ